MALTEGGGCVVPDCKWQIWANHSVRDAFKKHYCAHMEIDQAPEAEKALRQISAIEELEDRVEYPTREQIREVVENA